MCKRSDIELIMLVRQAVEQMVLNSEATIDPKVHHEYLHLIDELKAEIERTVQNSDRGFVS